MEYADILAPLDIEMRKVASLNGSMAIVVVPEKYSEKALSFIREVDTVVRLKDYLVLGIFGAQADEASARFLSVPKGIAIYPQDGKDIQALFFEALDRLRFMGSSTWVKRLWESIKDTKSSDNREDPESRFVSATFYQFLAFMLSHPKELQKVFAGQDMAELFWVKDYVPSGFFSSLQEEENISEEHIAALFQHWPYQEKMEAKLEKGKKTLRKFRNIEHLFTLPSISQEIIDTASDSVLAAGKMARIIEKDPVLTSKILKVVNSAFYGFRRQVDTVEQAVFILGNEEVVNLAFSIAIHKILETISPLSARKLWEHSLEVGQLAQWMGPLMGYTARQRLFTVGLLHDFGKIVFLQRGYYTGGIDGPSVMEDLAAEEMDSGISHAEMGAYVAERWNLPEAIVDALLGHHLPSKAKDMSLAVTVHLSDVIAHCGQIDVAKVNNAALRYLSERNDPALSQENVMNMAAEIKRRVCYMLDE
jgi:HD-like signal output (HDOD) protein